jgi:hypothetical protein
MSQSGAVCLRLVWSQQINITLRPLFSFLLHAKLIFINSCTTMEDSCDIPEDVRKELDLVHADRGTYIDLDKMRTVGYASLDYFAILDTLEREIPKYNLNFLRVPNPPGWVAKETELREVIARDHYASVQKSDFHAFFVHIIDNERHVIRSRESVLPLDERHAIHAITIQLWNLVDPPSSVGVGTSSQIIIFDARGLLQQFEVILKKHAEVARGLRKKFGLFGLSL